MELRDYVEILRIRWRLIVSTTLLGVMAAAVASMLATPLYQSCTTQFVSANGGDASVGTAYTGSLFTQSRVKSYVSAVTSTAVMQTVVNGLNTSLTPGQVASKIDVSNPLDTVNLVICATDANPVMAQRIASVTAAKFTDYVPKIEVPDSTTGQAIVQVQQLDAATLPTSPVSPRTKINIALGFLVGLAIGVGAAVLLETLDTRIKSIENLAKHFDQTLLGVIGFDPDAVKHPLIVSGSAQSKRSESFRRVRTNLQFVDIDHRPKSIVVTSSTPREGKSTTAINLAITLAQTGQPVFLVEGDLRRPKIADYLGIEGNAGLTDVLVGRATLDEVMQPWGTTGNLWVLAAGPLPPNPSELLGSQSMADLLHHMETRATLIIDSPPLLPVTDAAVLSQMAGGAIIVIHTGKTRREQLRTAEGNITAVGGKILGLVMNMAPAKGPDSYGYGYAYSYDYKTIETRGKLDENPPIIPAGLGGMPGVNGSPTPAMPIGPVPRKKGRRTDDPPVVDPSVDEKTNKPEIVKAPTPAPAKKDPSPSAVVDRALGRDGEAGGKSGVVVAPASDALVTGTSADASPLEPVVARDDKVIGHSLKVPLPEPVVEDPPMAFEPDAVPIGDWTPPKPRPAFDPLTAPLDEISNPE